MINLEYTISQAAKKMNLTTYTLRYYDREGLLPSIKRNKWGNRIFTQDDLEMLSVVCCLKNTGMSIKDIKQFTDWQNQGNYTLHARSDMLLRHKENVLKQIDSLKKNLILIDRKLSYYQNACSAYDSGLPVPHCCGYSEKNLD
ncbi:MAG: MerR family transcriptional regulator [Clostridium luticellarii]|nr:MerR family transcriptional regulator [Clostridium luticellarii]MCI2040764.1 MerR family transcriptional regulator [Clostridium luticellarii]